MVRLHLQQEKVTQGKSKIPVPQGKYKNPESNKEQASMKKSTVKLCQTQKIAALRKASKSTVAKTGPGVAQDSKDKLEDNGLTEREVSITLEVCNNMEPSIRQVVQCIGAIMSDLGPGVHPEHLIESNSKSNLEASGTSLSSSLFGEQVWSWMDPTVPPHLIDAKEVLANAYDEYDQKKNPYLLQTTMMRLLLDKSFFFMVLCKQYVESLLLLLRPISSSSWSGGTSSSWVNLPDVRSSYGSAVRALYRRLFQLRQDVVPLWKAQVYGEIERCSAEQQEQKRGKTQSTRIYKSSRTEQRTRGLQTDECCLACCVNCHDSLQALVGVYEVMENITKSAFSDIDIADEEEEKESKCAGVVGAQGDGMGVTQGGDSEPAWEDMADWDDGWFTEMSALAKGDSLSKSCPSRWSTIRQWIDLVKKDAHGLSTRLTKLKVVLITMLQETDSNKYEAQDMRKKLQEERALSLKREMQIKILDENSHARTKERAEIQEKLQASLRHVKTLQSQLLQKETALSEKKAELRRLASHWKFAKKEATDYLSTIWRQTEVILDLKSLMNQKHKEVQGLSVVAHLVPRLTSVIQKLNSANHELQDQLVRQHGTYLRQQARLKALRLEGPKPMPQRHRNDHDNCRYKALESEVERLRAQLQESREREMQLLQYPDLNGPIEEEKKSQKNDEDQDEEERAAEDEEEDLVREMSGQLKANQLRVSLLQEQNVRLERALQKLQHMQKKQSRRGRRD